MRVELAVEAPRVMLLEPGAQAQLEVEVHLPEEAAQAAPSAG